MTLTGFHSTRDGQLAQDSESQRDSDRKLKMSDIMDKTICEMRNLGASDKESQVRYDMPLTFWKLAKTRPQARWGTGDSHATASSRKKACTKSRLPTDQGKLSRCRSLLCPPCRDLAPPTYPPEESVNALYGKNARVSLREVRFYPTGHHR
jgi:hypothetical protein